MTTISAYKTGEVTIQTRILIAVAVIGLCACPFPPPRTLVFFAGGQSNASVEWADRLQELLQAAYPKNTVIVVHQRHPGQSVVCWYDDGPRENFVADFHGSEESLLANAMARYPDARFAGIFWFQGENDVEPTLAAEWQSRTLGMITGVHEYIGDDSIPCVYAVIALNGSPSTPTDSSAPTTGT